MKHYIISHLAWRDLRECALFIGHDSSEYAIRFLDAAYESFEQLAGMPSMGTSYEAISQAFYGMRRFPIKGFEKYLIFYIPITDSIEIIRVIHAARDMQRIFNSA